MAKKKAKAKSTARTTRALSENIYELLGNIDVVTKGIEKLELAFNKGLRKLEKKYPDAGIGDTATDEAIVSSLYSLIHR